jgi:enamine deaminase RidA (YjgF/YER057c/UK114 family)
MTTVAQFLCNLPTQLAAAGMGFDNLVKVTMIIPDAAEIPASRSARSEPLGDRRPASTVIVGLARSSLENRDRRHRLRLIYSVI